MIVTLKLISMKNRTRNYSCPPMNQKNWVLPQLAA